MTWPCLDLGLPGDGWAGKYSPAGRVRGCRYGIDTHAAGSNWSERVEGTCGPGRMIICVKTLSPEEAGVKPSRPVARSHGVKPQSLFAGAGEVGGWMRPAGTGCTGQAELEEGSICQAPIPFSCLLISCCPPRQVLSKTTASPSILIRNHRKSERGLQNVIASAAINHSTTARLCVDSSRNFCVARATSFAALTQ